MTISIVSPAATSQIYTTKYGQTIVVSKFGSPETWTISILTQTTTGSDAESKTTFFVNYPEGLPIEFANFIYAMVALFLNTEPVQIFKVGAGAGNCVNYFSQTLIPDDLDVLLVTTPGFKQFGGFKVPEDIFAKLMQKNFLPKLFQQLFDMLLNGETPTLPNYDTTGLYFEPNTLKVFERKRDVYGGFAKKPCASMTTVDNSFQIRTKFDADVFDTQKVAEEITGSDSRLQIMGGDVYTLITFGLSPDKIFQLLSNSLIVPLVPVEQDVSVNLDLAVSVEPAAPVTVEPAAPVTVEPAAPVTVEPAVTVASAVTVKPAASTDAVHEEIVSATQDPEEIVSATQDPEKIFPTTQVTEKVSPATQVAGCTITAEYQKAVFHSLLTLSMNVPISQLVTKLTELIKNQNVLSEIVSTSHCIATLDWIGKTYGDITVGAIINSATPLP